MSIKDFLGKLNQLPPEFIEALKRPIVSIS